MELYDFQQADVETFLNEPTYAGINASTVGVGKTLVATEISERLGARKVLVLAPLNTLDGWQRHFEEHANRPVFKIGGTTAADKHNLQSFLDPGCPGVFWSTWEFARRQRVVETKINKITGKEEKVKEPLLSLKGAGVDFLIADEVHRAQNRNADSSTVLQGFTKAMFAENDEARVLAMSATPAGNRLPGMYGVARALWPEAYKSGYHKWWKRFFEPVFNQWSGFYEPGDEETTGSVVSSLPCYWRHEQGYPCCDFHPRGVQEDLPSRVEHRVTVELTATQRRIYEDIKEDAFAWIEDNDIPIETQGLPLLAFLRLSQVTLAVPTPEMVKFLKTVKSDDPQLDGTQIEKELLRLKFEVDCKSSKIDALLDIAADLGDERFMVYTHSTAIIPAIVHRLKAKGINAEAWDGSKSGAQRDEIKRRFVQGTTQVIVAQIAAIGEGVDGLQRVCANEIWFSRSPNSMLNIQCAGRLSRTGQERTVNVWNILADDTVEIAHWYTQSERDSKLHTSLQGVS